MVHHNGELQPEIQQYFGKTNDCNDCNKNVKGTDKKIRHLATRHTNYADQIALIGTQVLDDAKKSEEKATVKKGFAVNNEPYHVEMNASDEEKDTNLEDIHF